MTKRYCIFVNRESNSGKTVSFISRNKFIIKKHLPNVRIEVLSGSELTAKAVEIAPTIDVLIACGGDGTVQTIARVAIRFSKILGILPVGSGNDFAKMLGLSSSLKHNLAILNNEPTAVDVLLSNRQVVLNTLGFGVDGLTNNYARVYKRFGSLKYFIAGFVALKDAQLFEMEFTFEGTPRKCSTFMAVCANGQWEGGKYRVSSSSIITDGEAELVIVNTKSRFRLLLEFLKMSFGFSLSRQIIETLKFTNLHIQLSQPVEAHADGEVVSIGTDLEICVLPRELNVLAQKIL